MNTTAEVRIWNNRVGAVTWNDDRGFATFEYDPEFLKLGIDLSPLKMPLEETRAGRTKYSFRTLNRETYKGLPGLLADSLPDNFGNELIEAWLARQGRDAASVDAVERLCYTGKRGMGALEYEPVFPIGDDSSNTVVIDELVKLARSVLSKRNRLQTNLHRKVTKGLQEIIRIGSSAGGARAKAIIAYNKITGEVKSGQIDGLHNFEYWIIKLDGVTNQRLGDRKGYGRIEYAYYLMARDAGITMMESSLLKENNRAHFMTKRFDRVGVKKLHMQTLCALAHFDYNEPGLYSYEQAFQVMRELKLSNPDMEEFYRRMAFNVIAKNHDDHTKNISFLMNEHGTWSLSPAYDVTYAYDPKNRWMANHQMSINGKREDIKRMDMTVLANKMNIKKPDRLIDHVIESVSQWKKYGKIAGVPKAQIKSIDKSLLLKI